MRAGRLAAGEVLPGTRELALALRMARGTVVEAYEQLIAEGYLDARSGSGTFVAAGAARAVPDPPDARRPSRASPSTSGRVCPISAHSRPTTGRGRSPVPLVR